jgi:hypothetical protein
MIVVVRMVDSHFKRLIGQHPAIPFFGLFATSFRSEATGYVK